MSDITPERLAEELVGSTHTLTEDERKLLDESNFAETFDGLVFECEACGWWCSTDELNDQSPFRRCDDCEDAATMRCTD